MTGSVSQVSIPSRRGHVEWRPLLILELELDGRVQFLSCDVEVFVRFRRQRDVFRRSDHCRMEMCLPWGWFQSLESQGQFLIHHVLGLKGIGSEDAFQNLDSGAVPAAIKSNFSSIFMVDEVD